MPHKIEEEVAVGDADDLHISHKPREWKRILRTRGLVVKNRDSFLHLVSDLDKQTEAFGGFEQQTSRDAVAEVFGFGAGLHLKHLKRTPDRDRDRDRQLLKEGEK